MARIDTDLCYVGMDYGGTWVRTFVLDYLGKLLYRWQEPSVPLAKLPAYIENLLIKFELYPARTLVLGARGVWQKSDKDRLTAKLANMAHKVLVLSDVELAYQAALGGGYGMVLLAGTGSIALGYDKNGSIIRSGGKGALSGDEGSAFWIGKQYLAVKGQVQNGKSVREVASFCPQVLKLSAEGDVKSGHIVRQAQKYLAQLVSEVALKLKFEGNIPFSYAGSLASNARFRKGVLKIIVDQYPKLKLQVIKPKWEAVRWAVDLAFRAANASFRGPDKVQKSAGRT